MLWLMLCLTSPSLGGPPRALDPLRATVEVGFQVWRFISLADGPRCPFMPTCSAFAVQAMRRDGLLGVPLVADRLVRDNVARGYPLAPDHQHRLDPLREHVPIRRLLRGCRAERRRGAEACTYR